MTNGNEIALALDSPTNTSEHTQHNIYLISKRQESGKSIEQATGIRQVANHTIATPKRRAILTC